MSSMRQTKLFLHMGPGLNAFAEQKLLAPHNSDTLYWDQPFSTKPAGAFSDLVSAACDQVQRLVDSTGGPIGLVAHSFGGHIAAEILRQHPERISGCDFYATGFDISSFFLNLLREVYRNADPALRGQMPAEVPNLLKSRLGEKDKLWNYIQAIAQDPGFGRLYWPNQNHFQKYAALMAQGKPMDMATFQSVLTDFYADWNRRLEPVRWKGPIQIFYGSEDHLVAADHDQSLWLKILPQANFKFIPGAGHLLHLEKYLD